MTAALAVRPAWMPGPDETAAFAAAELAELRADYPGWVIEEDAGQLAAWPRTDPAAAARTAPDTAVMRNVLAAAAAAAAPAPRLAAAPVGTVYLLHFSRRLGHARHYTGWSAHLAARLRLHRAGRSGVPLVRAAVAAGIGLELARTWENRTRAWERQLKNRHGAAAYCPLCAAERRARAASPARAVLAGAAS